MKTDLRRERGLQIAARQDRVHLTLHTEVRTLDAPLARLQRLVDQLAERDEPAIPRPNGQFRPFRGDRPHYLPDPGP
jgi:hypothetical protein